MYWNTLPRFNLYLTHCTHEQLEHVAEWIFCFKPAVQTKMFPCQEKQLENMLQTLTTKSNLSESKADPSSYSSRTISGSTYSFSTYEDDSEDFLRKMAFNIPFTGFFCVGTEVGGFSWGNISTTMQVVSSLSPFARKDS